MQGINNKWITTSGLSLFLFFLAVLGFVIWHFGDEIGLTGNDKKNICIIH